MRIRHPIRPLSTALAMALLLAGCGSSPHNNYYLLSALQNSARSGEEPSVGIGPIEIPEYLKRNSMVYTQGTNQLRIAGNERWAEPLREGVQRVLGLNLAALLDTQNIRPYPWQDSNRPDYAVQLWLLGLDAADTGSSLVAEWRVYTTADNQVVARRLTRLNAELPGGTGDAGAIAASYSELLQELSEEIATAINSDRNTVEQ